MGLTELIGPPQRAIYTQPENRVKRVTKLADGGMEVEFHSGKIAVLSAGDEQIQAFVIYSVLAEI